MKWMKRLNTVFYRLILSYTVLILIVIGSVGTGSYLYFKSSLNEQIEKLNKGTLDKTGDTLFQYVVELSEKMYIRLIMDTKGNNDVVELFDTSYEYDYNKIVNAYTSLINERQTQLDIVDNIEVYYNNYELGISTRRGVKYYSEEWLQKPEWLILMEHTTERTAWFLSKDTSGNDTVVFVRAYPYAQPKEMARGYVAIHIQSQAVSRIIRSGVVQESSSLFLLDGSMQLIVSEGEEISKETLAQVTDKISISGDIGNEMMETEYGPAIVSFTTVSDTGWKIVSLTRADVFYNKSIALRDTLILLCFIVILLGIVLSHIFTWNLYNPIKRLFQATTALLGPTSATGQKSVNEISFINYAINKLSVKVNKLESTLNDNLPLIKHHIVQSIFYESYPGKKELEESLNLLRLKWAYRHYYCVRLRLDAVEMAVVDVQSKHFIMYSLMDELESHRSTQLLVLAIEVSDTDICCIIGHDTQTVEPIRSLLESIIGYSLSSLKLLPTVAVSTCADGLEGLGASYRETEMILKYAYFRPEAALYGSLLLEREGYAEPFPAEIINEFDLHLRELRMDGLRNVLERARALSEHGPYSAEQCHEGWRQLISCLYHSMKQYGIFSNEVLDLELQEKLRGARNVVQLEEWLLAFVEQYLILLEKKLDGRKYELIEKACQYIEDNVQEPISLELVGEYVSLTPRYLSKLFKEERGSSFTDYVTQVRLNKAKELIHTTSHSIEQIAVLVGFSSSAYFIRKFKEMFGSTPKVFRSRMQ